MKKKVKNLVPIKNLKKKFTLPRIEPGTEEIISKKIDIKKKF